MKRRRMGKTLLARKRDFAISSGRTGVWKKWLMRKKKRTWRGWVKSSIDSLEVYEKKDYRAFSGWR